MTFRSCPTLRRSEGENNLSINEEQNVHIFAKPNEKVSR